MEEGLRVHVVELPAGHDPDTFLKEEGGSAYAQRLDCGARGHGVDDPPRGRRARHAHAPRARPRTSRRCCPLLVKIDSAVERAAWLPRIAERGGLDEAAAREELRRAAARGGRGRFGSAWAGNREPRPAPAAGAGCEPPPCFPPRGCFWACCSASAEGIDEALGELATPTSTACIGAGAARGPGPLPAQRADQLGRPDRGGRGRGADPPDRAGHGRRPARGGVAPRLRQGAEAAASAGPDGRRSSARSRRLPPERQDGPAPARRASWPAGWRHSGNLWHH